ncbi:MAG: hypothetical protein AAGA78_18485, partial [Pseudomonadota bacterium]
MSLIDSRVSRRLFLGASVSTVFTPAWGEPIFTDGQGLALQGYDPVAFFKLRSALKGSPDHEIADKDRTWRFASEAHLTAFEKDREAFMPAFGGYDAWGISR